MLLAEKDSTWNRYLEYEPDSLHVPCRLSSTLVEQYKQRERDDYINGCGEGKNDREQPLYMSDFSIETTVTHARMQLTRKSARNRV